MVYSEPPHDFQFHKMPNAPTVVQADGNVYYERYENGLMDDYPQRSPKTGQ